jgi:hypothetical protein
MPGGRRRILVIEDDRETAEQIVEFLAARRGDRIVKEVVLRVGDLELDLVSRAVSRCGRKIDLLPREFQVLGSRARVIDYKTGKPKATMSRHSLIFRHAALPIQWARNCGDFCFARIGSLVVGLCTPKRA